VYRQSGKFEQPRKAPNLPWRRSSLPPQPGNPAIDRVPIAACGVAADQRGALRPAGSACDSGAVELGGIVDLILVDGFLLPEASARPVLIRQR